MTESKPKTANYTCNDYREEMILLGLQKQLTKPDLTPEEKERIETQIREVEKQMGMD